MQVKDAGKTRRGTLALGMGCLLLQLAVAPHVTLGNGYANFGLVYAGVVALAIGGRKGVIAGFVGGLVFDLTSTTPIGLMAMILTVFGYVVGMEARNRFGDGLASALTTFGMGSLGVMLAYHLTMLLLGDASNLYDCLMLRAFPSFALTFLAFLPFAYWQVRATGKGRGRSKGSPGSHRGSSHYDVSNL